MIDEAIDPSDSLSFEIIEVEIKIKQVVTLAEAFQLVKKHKKK